MLARIILCGTFLLGACAVEDGADDETNEIVDNLLQAGYPESEIMVVDGQVYVGLDAHVTLEASREMISDVGAGEEQYRTNNLVAAPKTICINPASSYAGNATFSQGLDLAIGNYNEQALSITFVRGPAAGCDANIAIKVSGPTGGSSGFPSGGQPYGEIKIGSGTKAYGVDVVEHVVTHEIGHTVGFRHSDYYDRSISCGGSATNEGQSTVGAILITGTSPTAVRGGSLMNSCFRSSETGEWLGDDVTALHALY